MILVYPKLLTLNCLIHLDQFFKMLNKLKTINNIPFLICLIGLLINDFYLKNAYHNWLTGKLSDFCGLFVFMLFWTAFFPRQKRIIYFSTALLFVFWKSPYVQSFIDFFSQYFYTIHRVIDITDLIALLVLPIAYNYHPKDWTKLKFTPIPLILLSIFAFCATSMPPPTQRFEQPQYLLFKAGIIPFIDNQHWNEYKIHKIDSFLLIAIKEIHIERTPNLSDEYHKVKILEALDLYFLREATENYRQDLSTYKSLRDSLMIPDETSITLQLDEYKDKLLFKNARLNGVFERLTKDNELLIEGAFINGIESGTWTYFAPDDEIVIKKIFKNGELTKASHFKNSKIILEQAFNTRGEIIRNKYFQLVFIALLISFLITQIITNYKKFRQKEVILSSLFLTLGGIIILPLLSFILAKMVSSIIPNTYTALFFNIIPETLIVYIIGIPFFVIFYFFLRKNKWDFLFYILLFVLGIVFVEEFIYLQNIKY